MAHAQEKALAQDVDIRRTALFVICSGTAKAVWCLRIITLYIAFTGSTPVQGAKYSGVSLCWSFRMYDLNEFYFTSVTTHILSKDLSSFVTVFVAPWHGTHHQVLILTVFPACETSMLEEKKKGGGGEGRALCNNRALCKNMDIGDIVHIGDIVQKNKPAEKDRRADDERTWIQLTSLLEQSKQNHCCPTSGISFSSIPIQSVWKARLHPSQHSKFPSVSHSAHISSPQPSIAPTSTEGAPKRQRHDQKKENQDKRIGKSKVKHKDTGLGLG
jgi:hypothetical protein